MEKWFMERTNKLAEEGECPKADPTVLFLASVQFFILERTANRSADRFYASGIKLSRNRALNANTVPAVRKFLLRAY
jgi:hypothetical protein